MYFLRVDADFSAALYLSNCGESYKGMHGHDFKVRLTIYNNELHNGMVYDYTTVKSALNDVVISLDNILLNDIEAFTIINPTVEIISKYIYDNLLELLVDLPIYEVEVSQSKGLSASFRPKL